MKNVIIVGASGMIGGIILRECIQSPDITKVTSIVRKPGGINHTKIKEITHQNFADYNGLEAYFKNQDIAYFCIGVYTGQVPDEEFKRITVDFVKSFADVLKENSPEVRFCFLSGQGADQKEKSRLSFARYKGMAENQLLAKQFKGLHIFRPAYIYPVDKRKEPNFSYRLMRKLYPLIKSIYPAAVITSEQLGFAMFNVGLKGIGDTVLENQDIKKLL